MTTFISAIGDAATGVFNIILDMFRGVGGLIFTISEAGAITGLEPFGYVFAAVVGVPMAAWGISKIFGIFSRIKIGGAR